MKKSLIITLFAVVFSAGAALAQTSTFEKSKRLTESEVPVAVIKAFQNDHSDLQDKGYWKLHYIEKSENGRTTFIPERYTFNGKKDGEKIVLTYSTEGVLESTKGGNAKK